MENTQTSKEAITRSEVIQSIWEWNMVLPEQQAYIIMDCILRDPERVIIWETDGVLPDMTETREPGELTERMGRWMRQENYKNLTDEYKEMLPKWMKEELEGKTETAEVMTEKELWSYIHS